MASFPALLFVYGTLMRPCSNSEQMAKGCRFLAPARTLQKYALYHADFPFVTKKQKTSEIYGEIFEVLDQATLDRLDEFEGSPDWYCREPVEVVNLDTNEVVEAGIYFNEVFSLDESVSIPSGRYIDFPGCRKNSQQH
jgi:gamma-glutamylcyclotransferase (GGCT)/AIG2-like uncharacterized protein YtfP